MVQIISQFGGLPNDDPNEHIISFLEICDTQKHNDPMEMVRLILFSFSLKDKAKMWFNSLSKDSIATWEEMAYKFLTKYFLPSKAAKLRGDITNFYQFSNENIYEAWERYKGMLMNVPHLGFLLGWRSNFLQWPIT